MKHGSVAEKLGIRESSISLKHIMDNSKIDSGSKRDVDFFLFLIENKLLSLSEAVLKRKEPSIVEEYYLERYKKLSHESDRHFLCRTIIQDELKKLGIDSISGKDIGNMEILRSNCSYDIVTFDFTTIIDVGLTPARNYFRGLTDLKVKDFLITSYFDDYMDEIIFSVISRTDDTDFLDAVKEFEELNKLYIPGNNEISSNEKRLQ